MTTNTTTTDLKIAPEEHLPKPGASYPPPAPPGSPKPRKRGFIWVLLLLIVVAVAGYAVWRAGQPGLVPVSPNGGGRRGGGRGAGAFGPIPVVVAKASSTNVPVYL